jgi:hypothetical protein
MIEDYLNVKELQKYTTLTNKQIRNNLNNLKNSNKFGSLIRGGGKGKGGQFWFHYSLIPFISIRQRQRVSKNIQTTIKERKLSELFYSKTLWDYFGCIHPNKDVDMKDLLNSLNHFISFYVIHRQNEINHIHFTLQSNLKCDEIKDHFKTYYLTKGISIDKVFLVSFNRDFKDDTINYLLRKGIHSSKNDLIDWGLGPHPFHLY